MGETIKLKSSLGGFEFSAYHELPFTPRKGGVIVVQEIFGIDEYIRADVARWAKAGYEAIAPALFDRRAPGFVAHHDQDGIAAGIGHARNIKLELSLSDIAACRRFLAPRGKVCLVGYCYGGSLSWIAAGTLDGFAAVSSYYGSLVKANAHLVPKCPTILHFGHADPGINAEEVEAAVKTTNPDLPVYIYEGAGHGFNNESPERYSAEAADLARQRTRELFEKAG